MPASLLRPQPPPLFLALSTLASCAAVAFALSRLPSAAAFAYRVRAAVSRRRLPTPRAMSSDAPPPRSATLSSCLRRAAGGCDPPLPVRAAGESVGRFLVGAGESVPPSAPAPCDDVDVLADRATRAAAFFCRGCLDPFVMGKIKLQERRSLQAAAALLDGDDPTGGLSVLAVLAALALPDAECARAASRAASSAIASAVSDRCWDGALRPASAGAVRALLSDSAHAPGADTGSFDGTDLHIVLALARAFGVGGSESPCDGATADAATLAVRRVLDADPEQAAPALALAAHLGPWTRVDPVDFVASAAAHGLWHAGEGICASAERTRCDGAHEAVDALVGEALAADMSRRADAFATRFYGCGGRARYVEAKLAHAKDTVRRVVRKKALAVIERQVARVDRAVLKVGPDSPGAATAGAEIRSHALQNLEEAGEIEAAHRLAELWGVDYSFDEEAVAAAIATRRAKYLQWDDLVKQDVPHLVSTPEALTSAFAHLEGAGPATTYGFDVEWADPDGAPGGGAGASLLQVASRHMAVLVDVPALSSTPAGAEALRRTVGALFDRARTEVVGFGCKQDLGRLRSSPHAGGGPHWLSGTGAVVDLQATLQVDGDGKKRMATGLSAVCEKYLGKPLDKVEQCSAWGSRPLTERQRAYAALDAWVCVAVYQMVMSKTTSIATGNAKEEGCAKYEKV